MASGVARAQMIPAAQGDKISPGSFYTACLNLRRRMAPESYWVVMRVPFEWLPRGFFDTRPASRVFPFWVIGKDQRVWLPRSSLYNLAESQEKIYPDRYQKQVFAQIYGLIVSFSTPKAALAHFEQEIRDSTQRYNEQQDQIEKEIEARRSSSSSIDDDRDGDNGTGDIYQVHYSTTIETESNKNHTDNAKEKTARKRQRRDGHAMFSESGLPAMQKCQRIGSGIYSQPLSLACDGVIIKQDKSSPSIKQEELSDMVVSPTVRTKIHQKHVQIYVGPQDQEFIADSSVLERVCPALYSMVVKDSEAAGGYITDPKLRTVDVNDFYLVMKYVHTGDFPPKLVENPDGMTNAQMALDKETTAAQYSHFVIQAGRLYLLAKEFQVKGLEELIAEKVMKGRWYKKYSNISLMYLAKLVMFTPRGEPPNTTCAPAATISYNQFEQWIIDQLAGNFMSIMGSAVEQGEYLRMVYATSQKQIHAAVLEAAAAKYRKVGGLIEMVEDLE